MSKSKQRLVPFTARLSQRDAAALESAARERKVSVATIIREAIAQRLDARSMAEPLREEIAQEAARSNQILRDTVADFRAEASAAVREMREAVIDQMQSIIGAITEIEPPQHAAPLPSATGVDRLIASRAGTAPGAAPR